MEELKIELTVEEINILLSALNELPFKTVNGLIFKIKNQAEAQLTPAPSAPDEAPAKKKK